jgi:hypothetical protein
MYCNVENVQSLIKWTTFTDSSKVTRNDVTNFILEADAFINNRLNSVYETPITDNDDTEILKYISCRLAAFEVAQVLVLQTSGKMPEITYQWKGTATKRLGQIISRDIILLNSTQQDTTKGLYSFTSHGNSDNDYEDTDPLWKLGTEQW